MVRDISFVCLFYIVIFIVALARRSSHFLYRVFVTGQGRAGLEFVTGRGGACFHSPGPALTTGRGGYLGGDPRPAPVRGESPLIPWKGPLFSAPVLTGTRLGNGSGRGQGQGTLKKHAPPWAVQRGGAGSWAGGPVTNTRRVFTPRPRPYTGPVGYV